MYRVFRPLGAPGRVFDFKCLRRSYLAVYTGVSPIFGIWDWVLQLVLLLVSFGILIHSVDAKLESPGQTPRSSMVCLIAWPLVGFGWGRETRGNLPGRIQIYKCFCSVDLEIVASVLLVWFWGPSAVRAGLAGLQ